MLALPPAGGCTLSRRGVTAVRPSPRARPCGNRTWPTCCGWWGQVRCWSGTVSVLLRSLEEDSVFLELHNHKGRSLCASRMLLRPPVEASRHLQEQILREPPLRGQISPNQSLPRLDSVLILTSGPAWQVQTGDGGAFSPCEDTTGSEVCSCPSQKSAHPPWTPKQKENAEIRIVPLLQHLLFGSSCILFCVGG